METLALMHQATSLALDDQNKTKFKLPPTIKPPVFIGATVLIALLVAYASLFPASAQQSFEHVQNVIISDASWFYILTVALIFIFAVFLAVSRYGDIKLGPDDSTPDYGLLSWFAMLFSAGMGVGVMFFGVAEPVMHLLKPPVGDPQTINAAKEAMKITFFHWGLHAWSIYAVVALILSYFSYRHDHPLTLRAALYPLFGKRVDGGLGHAVDIFAILGTVFGIATTLGYGVQQINAGFNYLFGMPISTGVQVTLIITITTIASLSVATGLDKGIKRLSELNIGLAVMLMCLILLLGSTVHLLQAYLQNTGAYVSTIVSKTFNLYAYKKNHWIGGWTVLYWAWWLSWSPFVGMFIARISRGRTIREFILGAVIIPSLFTLLWMTVFGNSAIDMIMDQGISALANTVSESTPKALFVFLGQFPLSNVLSLLATMMIMVFFVTSFDSGAMVIDMLASGGQENTPLWQRFYWAGMVGIITIVLLMVGGLSALQSATIASALPFAIFLLVACFGLLKTLQMEENKRQAMLSAASMPTIPDPSYHSDSWKERVEHIFSTSCEGTVSRFIKEIVSPALKGITRELSDKGVEVQCHIAADHAYIETFREGTSDFIYGIRTLEDPTHPLASAGEDDEASIETDEHYRAEVYLADGSQTYDVMGYTKEQIIHDLLDHYQKHRHFLHLIN